MALVTVFSVLLLSYVHQAEVDEDKKVVCTAVVVVLYLIAIILSVVFGGPVETGGEAV